MPKPTLSIIIPVHNRCEYLTQAIASAKAQAVDDVEVIIVNDGSGERVTAEVGKIVQDAGVRLLGLDKNVGVSAARNAGLTKATGQYIIFLDDDDWLEPGFASAAIAEMSHNGSEVIMAKAEVRSATSPRRFQKISAYYHYLQQKYHDRPSSIPAYFLVYCPAIHCVVWRREVLGKDPFRETLTYGEDRELMMRLRKKGVKMVPSSLLGGYYRIGAAKESHDKMNFVNILLDEALVQSNYEQSYCHMLKAYFHFRRGNFGNSLTEFAQVLTSPKALLQPFVLFLRFRLFR